MNDPAGLVNRIPELEQLASIPSVEKALATGKPHKVYRALWWAHLLGRVKGSLRASAKALLGNRRLWLEGIQKAPSMHTVNGIGTAVYGRSELDPEDGTAIGTHFFVFVFMPLFPLGQYLYINHGNQYRFYGKAPLGPVAYAYRSLFALGTGAAILSAAWGAFDAAVHADLVVLNGTTQDVRVHVDGASRVIPAGGKKTLTNLAVEADAIRVEDLDGNEVERGELSLSSRHDANIWNVLGAGFLYEVDIAYTANPRTIPPEREPTFYCGDRFVQADADFLFREPSEEISMPEGKDIAWRTQLAWDPSASWMCSGVLMAEERHAEALTLALAAMDPQDVTTTELALLLYVWTHGDDEAATWVDGLLAEHDTVPLHRARQNLAMRAGDTTIAQAYQDRRDGTADADYLAARMLPPAESIPILLDALVADPEHELSVRSLAWNHAHQERWSSAATLYASAAGGGAELNYYNLAEVRAADGDLDGALELFRSGYAQSPDDLVAWALLERRSGGLWADASMAAWGYGALEQALQQVEVEARWTGGIRLDKTETATVEVVAALITDPDLARARAGKAELGLLPEAAALVLYGDALAAGDGDLVARIEDEYRAGILTPVVLAAARGEVADHSHLTLRQRSATALARALQPGVSEAERAELIAEATRFDAFGGLVHHVVEGRGL